ncbi:hypothetical protein ACVWW6_005525 [Bradyrhizobium sp. USDA 3311]
MAYDKNSLKRVDAVPYAAGSSKTLFLYATADTLATILAAGYFNADYKRFDQGDSIEVIATLGGTPTRASLVITSAKGASPVTVAAGELAGLVDNTGGTTGQALSANVAKSTLQFGLQNTDIAAGTIKQQVNFNGRLQAVRWRTCKPVTTAAKAATAQLGVNGVACTGGAVALASATMTPMGAAIAGSAITAGAAFTAGQTIEITFSAVTAFVEGDGWFEVDVIDDDLNNAIASLNAA